MPSDISRSVNNDIRFRIMMLIFSRLSNPDCVRFISPCQRGTRLTSTARKGNSGYFLPDKRHNRLVRRCRRQFRTGSLKEKFLCRIFSRVTQLQNSQVQASLQKPWTSDVYALQETAYAGLRDAVNSAWCLQETITHCPDHIFS